MLKLADKGFKAVSIKVKVLKKQKKMFIITGNPSVEIETILKIK